MTNNDRTVKGLLLLIVLLLAVIALRPYVTPIETVHAQTARFDHVTVVSALFLHGGDRGLLLLGAEFSVWMLLNIAVLIGIAVMLGSLSEMA